MRKANDALGNIPQLLLEFVQVGCQVAVSLVLTGKTTQIDREDAKLLCQVLVKFMANATAFDFLCVKQLSAQFPQTFFRFSSIREVDPTTDITEKGTVVSEPGHAIMKHPPINAVV